MRKRKKEEKEKPKILSEICKNETLVEFFLIWGSFYFPVGIYYSNVFLIIVAIICIVTFAYHMFKK